MWKIKFGDFVLCMVLFLIIKMVVRMIVGGFIYNEEWLNR